MDISIDRSELLKAVAVVNKAVNFRSTIPTLSGIFLSVNGMQLLLRSTNNEMSIDAKLDCVVREAGETVVLGRVLLDIVKNAETESIDLKMKDHNLLEVSGNKFKYNLNTMSPEDFPPHPNIADCVAVDLQAGQFSDLIKKVSRATTLDETRILYTGILLKVSGTTLEAVATDSYRLAINRMSLTEDAGAEKRAVIPSKNLNDVTGFISDDPAQKVTIELSDNLARFIFGNVVVTTRLIEGNFPRYEQVIPDKFDRSFKTNKNALVSTLKRMNVLAENHLGVKFTLGNEQCMVTVRSPEVGEAEEVLEGEYSGEATEVSVNMRYMFDGVSSLTGEETIFNMNEGTKPLVLTCPDDENFVYVIMPLRS